jgi:ferritin
MKISPELEKLLNEQVNAELFASNQYLAIAAYFADHDLDGFSNFFMVQAEEERFHALKYFKFLYEVDGSVKLGVIPEPVSEFASTIDVIEKVLIHEEKVTKAIYACLDAALTRKEFATYHFMEWFVAEQVEEEDLFRKLLAKLRLIGSDTTALYHLDNELGARKFSPSANA